ncbi:hypothetical protein B0H12DRAFT_233586 [Mycena haematopus]|nr:hypothetical protein B0H12DRAFT_233586 [Mycena haematopus]
MAYLVFLSRSAPSVLPLYPSLVSRSLVLALLAATLSSPPSLRTLPRATAGAAPFPARINSTNSPAGLCALRYSGRARWRAHCPATQYFTDSGLSVITNPTRLLIKSAFSSSATSVNVAEVFPSITRSSPSSPKNTVLLPIV